MYIALIGKEACRQADPLLAGATRQAQAGTLLYFRGYAAVSPHPPSGDALPTPLEGCSGWT